MPSLPAIASRCTTALVEPPMAASATIALWNEPIVTMSDRRRSASMMSTISRPVSCDFSSRRLSGAGVPARPGMIVPSASATSAMVEAVPIVLQCPRLRIIDDSDFMKSACESVPPRTSSLRRHTSVPHPSGSPRKWPVSIGPPGTTIAGRSTDAAAISSDGIVLSQPPSSTTPSMGFARSISSVAIAAMLRHSIAVGRTCVSPRETTGRFSGMPPASKMPALTCSATSSRCALHGVRSDAVFAIAMWGRPSKAFSGSPRRIQARWMYAFRSSPAYHSELRRSVMRSSTSRNRALPCGTLSTLSHGSPRAPIPGAPHALDETRTGRRGTPRRPRQ